MSDTPGSPTPEKELYAMIHNCHFPKSELEHWAAREIIYFQTELKRMSNELAHTKNQVIVNRKEADDLKAENLRLRDESEWIKKICNGLEIFIQTASTHFNPPQQ